MVKIYVLIASLFFFVVDSSLAVESETYSRTGRSVKKTSSESGQRRRRKRKPRMKKSTRRSQRRQTPYKKREAPQKSRTYKQGFYAIAGINYFMPSAIDFTPVIEAGGSSASVTNAELVHTGGVGLNIGVGYRILKNLSAELDLFMVYPAIGSEVSLNREVNGVPVDGIGAGAKVIIPRGLVKGIYPFDGSKIDLYAAAGVGYTQVLKTVGAEEEGIALAGISFHGLVGLDYELSPVFSIGGSFEYMTVSYSYVDVWETTLYDSSADGSVSVSQTMMIGGINLTYRF